MSPNELSLRAERSGSGDGRAYRIVFGVSDANGASCDGVVRVGVPHDRRAGRVAVESPAVYDSFAE
jgi:hypothetical protein